MTSSGVAGKVAPISDDTEIQGDGGILIVSAWDALSSLLPQYGAPSDVTKESAQAIRASMVDTLIPLDRTYSVIDTENYHEVVAQAPSR